MNHQKLTKLSVFVKSVFLLLIAAFFAPSSTLFSQTCVRNIYRTIDGSCNNIQNSSSQNWGGTNKAFYREMAPVYSNDDIYNGMNHENKPNPRAISNVVFGQNGDEGNADNLSSFVFTWGQFLDHDITFAKGARMETANIPLPPDEPLFTSDISFHRSAIASGTGIFNPRNQENGITAWIDGSQVYGSDLERVHWLRTFQDGKLKTSAGNLLPYNTLNGEKNGTIDPVAPEMDGLNNGQTAHFVAGDIRASEQPGLTTLHTLFVREHNRICEELVANGYNDDEIVFQMARKRVGALIQAITYEQFLPALKINLKDYEGYNYFVQPDIMNIFATAAYRIGHTMVTSELLMLNDDCSSVRNPLNLEEGFFNPSLIENFGIDPILKGLANQQQEAIDNKVIDGLRNFLFAIPQLPGTFGLDLAALNIQRGRDHGMPDFNSARAYFLGSGLLNFNQLTNDATLAQSLASLYNNDINKIDLWVGLLSESPNAGDIMGPTMEAILAKQFARLRDGDYYYYLNDPFLSPTEKTDLQNSTLSAVIKRNTSLNNLANDVFFAESCDPIAIDCRDIQFNVTEDQLEITNLTAPFSHIKIFDKNNRWTVMASCAGAECGTAKIFDLPTGEYFVQVSFYQAEWKDFICKSEMDIKIMGSDNFDCESVQIATTDAGIEVNGLGAPFSTVKVFDKNAGWAVVASCMGDLCGDNPTFDLPEGDYYVQVNAYRAIWQNLICSKDVSISLEGSTSSFACESVEVNARKGSIAVNGLDAPFTTLKVFDMDNHWAVAAQCIGDECPDNPSFSLPNSRYNVEVTLFQGVWNQEICRKYFPADLSAIAADRNTIRLSKSTKVFPNPVTEILNIDLTEYYGSKVDLQLSNQIGQVVYTKQITKLNSDLVQLPVQEFQNGVYYLTMWMDGALPVVKKVVVGRMY